MVPGKESKTEWCWFHFLVEPSIKKKFQAIIALKGYKSMSEAFRDYMRNIVESYEKEEGKAA